MLDHKSFSLSGFKALEDAEAGSFEAVVAVFGNVDHGGDRIQPGAFKRSLGEWAAKGRSVPILWSHDAETVPIGVVSEAKETQEGLQVKARLLVDDNPQARAVHAAMKAGALQEFSFGYGVREKTDVMERGRKVRVLKDLHLGEISPVFAGMNPATRLIGVKSAEIDLTRLGIDQLKTLGEEIAEQIEQRQTDALQTAVTDVVTGELGGVIGTPKLPEETNPEPKDNPAPNPTDEIVVGEEAMARIRALQSSRPLHLE